MINQAKNRLHRTAVPPPVSRDIRGSVSLTAPPESGCHGERFPHRGHCDGICKPTAVWNCEFAGGNRLTSVKLQATVYA